MPQILAVALGFILSLAFLSWCPAVLPQPFSGHWLANSWLLVKFNPLHHRAYTPIAIPSRVGNQPGQPRQHLQDLTILKQRRLSSIVGELKSPANIPSWIDSLETAGKWPSTEVDYTTGCAARRANWPAQAHWQRILVMSGAWHGGFQGPERWVKDATLRAAIGRAMAYWFQRDIKNVDCLDWGGTSRCPCDDPSNSLWNTNWFSNIILIPELAGQSCLLLGDSLTPSELESCSWITRRSFGTFDINLNGLGYLTGANTLDVARIGVDCGLLNSNVSMISDAYRRIHEEMVIQNATKTDGIRMDGSFAQHAGVLYNGNYGKDYSIIVLDVEGVSAGTTFAANATSRLAFETLFSGHRWMIFANSVSQVLHFDFSALGRFITFPVADGQASGGIHFNLTRTLELGRLWSSATLVNFAESLMVNSSTANAGNLRGNKMFYANDYMVHRGSNYVTSLKMYSNRTTNTECINSQNPLGFHLSDGTLYTYLRGDEYEDISAAWDWNLVPGTTTDYAATTLDCGGTRFTGIESFVGGASDGKTGVAAMRYTNPSTRALKWQKAWFFLNNDTQVVMINVMTSSGSAPLYSILDQKRRLGRTIVNGIEATNSTASLNPRTLWHDNVGYAFPEGNTNSTVLNLRMERRTGNWSAIGTSTQPPAEVDLWAGWIHHTKWSQPVEYTIFPGTTYPDFISNYNQSRIETIANNRTITAIYDHEAQVAMIVFWTASDLPVTIKPGPAAAPITLTSSADSAIIFNFRNRTVSVSDPSQAHTAIKVTIALGVGQRPSYWKGSQSKTLIFQMPSGGRAGDTVSQDIQ